MRHVIQKQQVLLTIPAGMDAFHAQHDASRYFRDQLLPALEKIFDELSGDDEVVHLDHLFIDLGLIGEALLRSGRLDDQVYTLLKSEVASAIEKELIAHPRIRQTVGQGVLQQWWYYMEHGYLPWNATGVPDEWPQKVLALYAVDFAAVTTLRKGLSGQPRVLARVVARHSDWFLENLVAVLTSTRQEGLGEVIDQACRVSLYLEERCRVLQAAGADVQGNIVMGHGSIRSALRVWSRRMAGFLAVPAREKKAFVWRWLLVEAASGPAAFAGVGGTGMMQEWIFDDSRTRDSLPLMEMVLADEKFADNSKPFIRLLQTRYKLWKGPIALPGPVESADARVMPVPPEAGAVEATVRSGDAIVPGRDAGQEEQLELKAKGSLNDANAEVVESEYDKGLGGVDVGPSVELEEKERAAELKKAVAGERPGGLGDGKPTFSERPSQDAAVAAIRSEKKGEVVEDAGVDEATKKDGSDPVGEDQGVPVLRVSIERGEEGRELAAEEMISTVIPGDKLGLLSDTADESEEAEIFPAGKDKAATAPGSEEALRPEEFLFRAEEVNEDGIYLVNAGIILVHPFLCTFFGRLGLWKEGAFDGLYARQKAVALLHFLATGEREVQEYTLVLAKVLCGLSLEVPLPREIVLTDEECKEGVLLLENVIRTWEKIGNTSIDGLRQGFLRRDGKLSERGGRLYLQMEISGIDVLLDYLPWNLSIVKLPWMKEILFVEWR
jgi:hypothetical protein